MIKQLLGAGLFSWLLCASALAQTIDINFSGTAYSINGQQGVYTGDGVASPVWNDVTSPTSSLVYSDGSPATGVAISFTNDGLHNLATTPNLLSWYFLAENDTKTVTLTGLTPNGNYQLYLYGQNGGYAYRGTIFSITQGSGVPATGSGDSTTGFGTGSFALGVNYVVFNAVADGTGTLTISYTANPEKAPAGQYSGVNTYGIFNGLQITALSATAGEIPFFQGFETNSAGVAPFQCGGTTQATLTTYAYGSCSPLGSINAPNASFGNKYAIATPDNSSWGCAMASYFGGQAAANNSDFIASPYPPYQGTFTQSIALYIPVSGAGAWTPPVNTGNAAFELNEDPNVLDTSGSPNYGLESNILFSVPSTGTVEIGWSGDANYVAASQATFAKITQSGWYTIAATYLKAGNGTTDPPLQVLSVYNSSGALLGAVTIPCGHGGTCLSQSSGLMGSGQLDLTYFQQGFAPNGVAFDNVQTYLGFPNAATAPVVLNSETYTGTHGQPFSLQIMASNSPTSYQASGAPAVGAGWVSSLPAGLSFNSTTGVISGIPVAAGTYYLALTAMNGTGVGTALVTLTVN